MSIQSVKATIDGRTYNLTLNSSTGKHEATITAPARSSYTQSGHYYDVSVTAVDVAGNSVSKNASDGSLGSSLQLHVKEKVAPVINIVSPTSGATLTNSKPTITWTAVDSDSGVHSSSICIDGGSAVTVTGTAITNGYRYTYTPASALSDGSHTITMNATDHDGNTATAATEDIIVDTVPPSLNITSPADHLVTNQSAVTVSGTTNDVTSGPVSLKVNGTAVTVGSDGSFSTTVNFTEGSNTITAVATDSAGKSTTVTREVRLDTAAPVFGAVTMTPNPVDCGKTFIISVQVTD